jgi:phosphatidylethanolamine N-methyltransferase
VQKEYRNKTITRIFGGNAYLGCYFLTACIFSAGMLRDHLYVAPTFFFSAPPPPPFLLSVPGLARTLTHFTYTHSYLSAILEQPSARLLPAPFDTLIPLALFAAGQTFVITSTWSLGITGTFLGDYFGILMDSRVEGFPFNVLRDPMYMGSTMCFAGTALWCVLPYSCGCAVMGLTFHFLQVRAPRRFADHLLRVHCVYGRFEV